MFHLIKYSVIRKVKNFSMLFWPCMFPLILGTLFYFAFGNISESDFETVQAAFVEENPGDSVFPSFLEEVSKEGTLIHVETMTEKEALQKLEDQKISGIFYGTETPYLKVRKNGLAQSIMQSLLESYLNGKDTLETVADVHPENMKKAVAAMSDYQELVENVSAGGRTTNGNMGFFYALAAMACMYGCFIGLGSAMWLQANLSTLAARQCVSPVHRLKMILTELISSFILHFLNVVILIVYCKYVLQMEFQGSMGKMLLIVAAGCVIGVSMGILVCSIGKFSEGIKVGIMLGISMTTSVLAGLVNVQIKLGISMVSSFLAGLMNGNMKDIVEKSVPIVNRINPASLISDAFYCINVYDDPVRFRNDILTLFIMCAVILAVSFVVVRRERYDSI